MEGSTQEKGQVRLRDATPQHTWGATGVSQACDQRSAKFSDVVGPAIGQRMPGCMPRGLDGIELRRVDRQLLQMQERILAAEVLQRLVAMDRRPVPYHKDTPAQMLEQVPEEVFDFIGGDVLGLGCEVEPQSRALGADRQAANHRDPGMVVAVANDRRLALRRPSAPERECQLEAGFVGGDDVCTLPRSVFLIVASPCASTLQCGPHSAPAPGARASGC